MTNELVLYEGEQDVKSLNSLTSESKNIKRITFDFSSHKLLTQNNISHSILENYISEDEKTVIDNFSIETEVAEPIISEELTKEESGETVLENLNEALEKAITEEEYEMAARLRDRIKQLEKESTSQ